MIKIFIFLILTVLSPVAQSMNQQELSSESSPKKRPRSDEDTYEHANKRARIDDQEKGALGLTDFFDMPEVILNGKQVTSDVASKLEEVLKKGTKLTSLSIVNSGYRHDDGIGDAQMAPIISGLAANSTLIKLDLNGNDLFFTLEDLISAAVKNNSTLRELDLSHSTFGDEHARLLSDALVINSSLKKLDLSHSSFGDEHARLLSDALVINSSLSILFLLDTSMCDDGTKALAQGLSKNRSLTKLWLDSYAGSSGGIGEIAKALTNNTFLVELRLFCNRLLPEDISVIAKTIKTNSTLEDIRLGVIYDFDEEGEKMNALTELSKALVDNITLTVFQFYIPIYNEEEDKVSYHHCCTDFLNGIIGQSLKKQLVLNMSLKNYRNHIIVTNDEDRKLFEIMLCCTILPTELVELIVKDVIQVEKRKI